MKSIPGSWSFTRWTTVGQLEGLEIRHPLFRAELFLQGAHLTYFAPSDTPNWLWLSKTAQFKTGRAIRGGIPICWPWFGVPERNPDEVRKLIRCDTPHGFARTAVWELEDVTESPQEVEVSLSLTTNDDFNDMWQGRATALLTYRFSAHSLHVALTTTNLGRTPLALSQALHTYLPTPDVTQTRISGLDHNSYIDTLQLWTRELQRGDITFEGETDRIYDTMAKDIGVHIPGAAYHLCSNGSNSAVVWNPGPEKSLMLSDFPDNAWQTMLCVETANALDDIRVLNSGQSHTLGVMISKIFGTKDSQ